MRIVHAVILFVSFYAGFSISLHPDVVRAVSCERDDVFSAIESAAYGDTVIIPFGTAVWTEPIVISNKSIIIFGESEGDLKPTIVDSIVTQASWNNAVFWFNAGLEDTIRVSNLNFYGKAPKPYGFIMMRTTQAFRVDNCTFDGDSLGQQRAIFAHNGAIGVFDNNVINIRARRTTQGLAAHGRGDESWNSPSSFGTINNFFVEDCEFNFNHMNDGAIDGYHGARVVFRYNRVNGTGLGWHGFDSGSFRSTFSFEIYNNVFNNDNANLFRCIRSRGGSALIHNNVITGNYDRFFILSSYRSCPTFEGTHTGETGTVLTDTNAAFSGTRVRYIYKVETNEADTVESFTSTTITSRGHIIWENGDKYAVAYFYMDCGMCLGYSPCDSYYVGQQGYPCLDQIGRGFNQELSPVYAWDNNFKGDTSPSFTVGYSCDREALHIRIGRDYFENMPKPGYTPFTYPHPYRISGPLADSDPPITIVNEKDMDIPFSFSLHQNYPNPFNPSTKINYSLPDEGYATLRVYDILGREVAVLVSEVKPAGNHSVQWDGMGRTGLQAGSGFYFYQLNSDRGHIKTKKMLKLQ